MSVTIYGKKHKEDCNCASCRSQRDPSLHPNWKGGISINKIEYMRGRYHGVHIGRNLKKKFGITLDEFNVMVKNQNGVYAICGKPENKTGCRGTKNLSVDHNHETGKIRGLLCYKCNLGIGNFLENGKLLTKAINYLKERN